MDMSVYLFSLNFPSPNYTDLFIVALFSAFAHARAHAHTHAHTQF